MSGPAAEQPDADTPKAPEVATLKSQVVLSLARRRLTALLFAVA